MLANRVTFGTVPEVESDIERLGLSTWIDQQLALSSPDPAVEAMLGSFQTITATRQQAYTLYQDDRRAMRAELTHSNILRARYSSHQVYEMMVHLWMDHFNVNLYGNGAWEHLQIDYQENTIRPNALGRFEDLLKATAGSPAMMKYLDNYRSNANSSSGVNENYGRELLELHTLGITPDDVQVYDESDVRAAAAVMSGWSVQSDNNNPAYSDFLYRPNYHETDPVSLLNGGFSSAGLAGKAAGDALLTYLANHPTTARHIAFKMIRRFITDTPSEALIASTAQVYLQNGTALAPTLRHILLSEEFATSTGQKMKRPFELVISSMRSLGSTIPTDPVGRAAKNLRYRLQGLNHEPWRWDQPDGYADFATPWLSSDGLLQRWTFSAKLANDLIMSTSEPDPILTDLAALRGNATTVSGLFDAMASRFGLTAVTAAQKTTTLGLIGVGEADPPSDIDDRNLTELAAYLLAHPQYQIR